MHLFDWFRPTQSQLFFGLVSMFLMWIQGAVRGLRRGGWIGRDIEQVRAQRGRWRERNGEPVLWRPSKGPVD